MDTITGKKIKNKALNEPKEKEELLDTHFSTLSAWVSFNFKERKKERKNDRTKESEMQQVSENEEKRTKEVLERTFPSVSTAF